jgi:hypothetical protein
MGLSLYCQENSQIWCRMKKNRFQRQDPPKRKLPITVIACEGETEAAYFEELRITLRKSTEIIQVVREGTAPISVVKKSCDTRDSLKSNKNWQQGDTAWAVFDGEEHQQAAGQRKSYNDAIQRAKSRDIFLANSNPSFELWLLLYHQEQWSNIHRDDVLAKLRNADPEYAKGTTGARKYGKAVANLDEKLSYENAKLRAEALHDANIKIGDENRNPMTNTHALTEHIRQHYR